MPWLFATVGGFSGGILIKSVFAVNYQPIIYFLLLAIILIGARTWVPRPAYSLGAFFCLFLALGITRATIVNTPLTHNFVKDIHKGVFYNGLVVTDPDVRDKTQRTQVRVTQDGETAIIVVVAPRYPQVGVGDTVDISGTLDVPKPFATDGGRTFRYDKYLEKSGVRFILNFGSLRVTEPAKWYSLPSALAKVKHTFLKGLTATLPEPYASLAGGIVIGGKSGLGNDLQEAFVKSGLIQIIVLSGYNIMVIAEWVMASLALTTLSRRTNAIFSALAVLIFVSIAGFTATAIRAMIMAFIALYARATGNTYVAARGLLVAIFIMLCWNPLYLAFDPGFDLSVIATAGLIWISPLLEMVLSFIKSAFWRNTVATTLAAQIAVLPILLYFTGNLSLIAIPANIIVSPIVPITMGLSAIAGFAGMIFGNTIPSVGILIAYPAYLANYSIVFIAEKSSSLPFANFIIPAFSFWIVFISYAIMIFIVSSKRFSTMLQLRFAKNASI